MGRLTRTEKLRAMEELWDDLTHCDNQYPSPEWHGDVLRKREEAVREGKDEFIPWEDAKRIRSRIRKTQANNGIERDS